MQFKRPENTDKYYWTRHSIGKMMQYGLSAQRVIRVIRSYTRIEEGIAENTIAVMQPTSTRRDKDGELKWNQEIWVMYQLRRKVGANSKKQIPNSKQISKSKFKNRKTIPNSANGKIRIISAWKFPGMSPKSNPIPREILEEIEDIL